MLLITLGAQELSAMQRVFCSRVYLPKTGARSFSKSAYLCHLDAGRDTCDLDSDFLREQLEMSKKSTSANTALLKGALSSKNYDLACRALPLFASRYTPVNNAETTMLVDLALENGFLDIAERMLPKGALIDSLIVKYATQPEIQDFLIRQANKIWKE